MSIPTNSLLVHLLVLFFTHQGRALQCFSGSCSKFGSDARRNCTAIPLTTCLDSDGPNATCFSLTYKSVGPRTQPPGGCYGSEPELFLNALRNESCSPWSQIISITARWANMSDKTSGVLVPGTQSCVALPNLEGWSQLSGEASPRYPESIQASLCACHTDGCNTDFRQETFLEFGPAPAPAKCEAKSGLVSTTEGPSSSQAVPAKDSPGMDPQAELILRTVIIVIAVVAVLCGAFYYLLYILHKRKNTPPPQPKQPHVMS